MGMTPPAVNFPKQNLGETLKRDKSQSSAEKEKIKIDHSSSLATHFPQTAANMTPPAVANAEDGLATTEAKTDNEAVQKVKAKDTVTGTADDGSEFGSTPKPS